MIRCDVDPLQKTTATTFRRFRLFRRLNKKFASVVLQLFSFFPSQDVKGMLDKARQGLADGHSLEITICQPWTKIAAGPYDS